MSLKSSVQSPNSAAVVAATEHALRNTQPETPQSCRSPVTHHASCIAHHRSPAFTLIEIMIVVAIMGIVMTMSVPLVDKVWRKAPLRKAVADVVEVFSNARKRAIMQGTMTQVVLHPKENRLEVSGAASASRSSAEEGGAPAFSAPAAGSGLSAQLSSDVIIQELD